MGPTKRRRILTTSKGIRYELFIALGLLVLAFLVLIGYIFPTEQSFFKIRDMLPVVGGIVALFLIISFIIILQMVRPVLKISEEVCQIAKGDFNRAIDLDREDEIGEIGKAINQMTHRIRENVEELKNYSKRTESINWEINLRIRTLSILMEISQMIAQDAPLTEVIQIAVEKCLFFERQNLACFIYRDQEQSDFQIKSIQGAKAESLLQKGIKDSPVILGLGFLGKVILRPGFVMIDKTTPSDEEVEDFQKRFNIKNAMIVPVWSQGKAYGLLIVGNEEKNFSFASYDIDLYQLMAGLLSIAITQDHLAKQVERAAVIDNLTGLFNNSFIHTRLRDEIKRAVSFQKPCSFVLLRIDRFQDYSKTVGHIGTENALIKIGSILREKLGKADKAARFGDHEFAVILPERNKRQAIEMAESIRLRIELIFSKESDPKKVLTCSGAVTENPIDGMTSEELILKAEKLLNDNMKQGTNRISYLV